MKMNCWPLYIMYC